MPRHPSTSKHVSYKSLHFFFHTKSYSFSLGHGWKDGLCFLCLLFEVGVCVSLCVCVSVCVCVCVSELQRSTHLCVWDCPGRSPERGPSHWVCAQMGLMKGKKKKSNKTWAILGWKLRLYSRSDWTTQRQTETEGQSEFKYTTIDV